MRCPHCDRELFVQLKKHDFESLPVQDLELSFRVERVLVHNMGLRTVSDLTGCTARDLLRQDNFGRVSLEEVRNVLRQLGLRLWGDKQ